MGGTSTTSHSVVSGRFRIRTALAIAHVEKKLCHAPMVAPV